MKHAEIMEQDKNFPVFQFCKENEIECSWDYDRTSIWTEVIIDGKMVFQIQSTATVEEFKELVKLNIEKYDNVLGYSVGSDPWYAIGSKGAFKKFGEKFCNIF